jgi:hypothetical protein
MAGGRRCDVDDGETASDHMEPHGRLVPLRGSTRHQSLRVAGLPDGQSAVGQDRGDGRAAGGMVCSGSRSPCRVSTAALMATPSSAPVNATTVTLLHEDARCARASPRLSGGDQRHLAPYSTQPTAQWHPPAAAECGGHPVPPPFPTDLADQGRRST